MQQQTIKELRESLRSYSAWASQLESLSVTEEQVQYIRAALQDMEDSELRVAMTMTERLRHRFF